MGYWREMGGKDKPPPHGRAEASTLPDTGPLPRLTSRRLALPNTTDGQEGFFPRRRLPLVRRENSTRATGSR
mgnify:CR=1 FL=1